MILRLACLVASLVLAAPATAAMLSVVELQGGARVERAGQTLPLAPGTAIAEGDRLASDGEGQFVALLGRHGRLELGPDSALVVERLPFAPWAADLQSVLRLEAGFLRLVWKRPGLASAWPLRVLLAGRLLTLGSGEYLFEARGERQSLCVGGGVATLADGEGAVPLRGPACYWLDAAQPSAPQAIDPDSLVRARQQRTLEVLTLPRLGPAEPDASTIAAMPGEMTESALEDMPGALDATSTELATVPPASATSGAATSAAASSDLPAASPSPITLAPPSPAAQPEPSAPLADVAASAPAVEPSGGAEPAAESSAAGAATASPSAGVVAAAPVAPSAPAPDEHWVLTLASYTEPAAAQADLARLAARGIVGVIERARVGGREWHRVRIRGIESAAAARALGQRLQQELGFGAPWLSRD